MDPKYSGDVLKHLEKQNELLMDTYRSMSHELHRLQVEEEMLMRKYYEFMAAQGLVDKKQCSANETTDEAIGQVGAALDTSRGEQPSAQVNNSPIGGQSGETQSKCLFLTHNPGHGTKPDSGQLGEITCSLGMHGNPETQATSNSLGPSYPSEIEKSPDLVPTSGRPLAERPSSASVSRPIAGSHVEDDFNTEGHEPRRSRRTRKPSSKYSHDTYQS